MDKGIFQRAKELAALLATLDEAIEDDSATPGAKKFDAGKPRTDLLPVRPLQEIAKVLAFGAQKYGERNWEEGLDWSRVYGAALRHLFAFWDGEDFDPETDLSHLAHAACCVLFLLEYQRTLPEYDDRP